MHDSPPPDMGPHVEIVRDGGRYEAAPTWAQRILGELAELKASLRDFEAKYDSDRQRDEQAFATLDRLVQQVGRMASIQQATVLERGSGNGLSSVTILVIEDDPDLSDVVMTWLKRRGAIVQLARTAREARRVLGALSPEQAPTHALIDVRLPDGSGVQLAREIGRSFPETRRVIYTGYADESVPRGVCEAQFGKPFTEAEAVRAILGVEEQRQ